MFKQILGEAFPLLEKVAPLIASVVGSPVAGSAAVVGMNLMANALGLNPANVEQVGPAILSHPEISSVLRSLESKFGPWLKSFNPTSAMPSSMKINIELMWDPIQKEPVLQISP